MYITNFEGKKSPHPAYLFLSTTQPKKNRPSYLSNSYLSISSSVTCSLWWKCRVHPCLSPWPMTSQ